MTTAASPRILIAGIGNVFLGDDGFGVEVARRLAARPLPPDVQVVDFGIRGLDLTFALLDDTLDVAILVDAAARGAPPGTLYLIEPEYPPQVGSAADPAQGLSLSLETHALDPARMLQIVAALGGRAPRLLLVGCEPTPLDPDEDPVMELSAPVQAAVDEAVRMVDALVVQVRSGRDNPDGSDLIASSLPFDSSPGDLRS
jgi:hydrogenase maturation protease